MASLCILLFLLGTFSHSGFCALKLANYFGDHMVLQRGPQQAVLWGTADTEGDTVTAHVTGLGADSAQVTAQVSHGKWKVKLPAQTAKGPFVVDVSSADGHVMLSDVLYGDVWLCSGQSNMYFQFQKVMNATAELQHALQFPDVRFTRAKLVHAATPQDHMAFDVPWSGPTAAHLQDSSAVCWLFGEYLQTKVQHPIGLVESSWGGTRIEAWSSTQTLADCADHTKRSPQPQSSLYNAMIHPLLQTTLFGALWYQGESNSGLYRQYACQIEAMVKEWRADFHTQSMQQTSQQFPFGYVQLAGLTRDMDAVKSFPYERWAQTANYGYSPNPALPDTFMAVAMDLPDFNSPYGAIHPRFKQDVAERLVRGALNVAYGQTSVTFQGPFPTGLTPAPRALHVVYDKGQSNLTVVNAHGYEVCCSVHNTTHCDDSHDHWVPAPISSHQASQVTLDTSGCGSRHVVGMRYEWRTSPCAFKQCALYDTVTGLPAPTYISHNMAANIGPEIIG